MIPEERQARLRPWAALSHRNYALLWSGSLVHMLGAWMQNTVRGWHLYVLTDSPLAVGGLGLAMALPVMIFSIVGGAIADSTDRRRLLVATQSASMCLTIVLASLTSTGLIEPWMIYAISFVSSSAAAFDQPARQALVPTLVPPGHINNAVTLLLVIRHAGLLLGPPVGGFVVAWFGIAPAYWINAATYVALIGALLAMHLPPVLGRSRPRASVQMLRDGFQFMLGAPIVLSVIGLDFVNTLFGTTRGLLPAFARDVFEAGPQGLGILAASPAVGGLLGLTTALALGDVRRKGVGSILCAMGFGVSVLGFAVAPGMAFACLGLAGYGFVDALGDTMRHTLLQIETPDELRGRVNSVSIMFGHAGPNLGQVLMGLLATLFGARESLLFGGAVVLAFAIGLAIFARPMMRYGARPRVIASA